MRLTDTLSEAESKAHEAARKLASIASKVPPEAAGEELSRKLMLTIVSLVMLAGRLHQLKRDIELGYKPGAEDVDSMLRELEAALLEAKEVFSRLEGLLP
ncbi:MAG: hypothetical protein DRN96_09720 [Thermoproteota archaeon]|nr:MAG: hypothetical protein DRN96_09720 [Candidatus Korarchaeota archaeon]